MLMTAPGYGAARRGVSSGRHRDRSRYHGPGRRLLHPVAGAGTRLFKGCRWTLECGNDPARGFARGARLMTVAADEPDRSGLVCVAVTGVRAPLAILEALSRPREELPHVLADLQQ